MQRARSLLAVAVFTAIAAISCTWRTETRPPSTLSHRDVARRDDAGAPSAPKPVVPSNNQRIRSFDEAKQALLQIYERHPVDLYCGCSFRSEPRRSPRVDLVGCGYVVFRDLARASRIEWEHVVAAATFGRTFPEWTAGDVRCVDRRGKRFRGRRCAERSPEFSRMASDLHNLFPVVGEVNAVRSDLPIGVLDPPDRAPPHRRPSDAVYTFGACRSTIEHGVFFPRPEVRGDVARASLYMDSAYPSRRILDETHRALFERWSAEDPPDAWERERNRAIEARQGNANPFIDSFGD